MKLKPSQMFVSAMTFFFLLSFSNNQARAQAAIDVDPNSGVVLTTTESGGTAQFTVVLTESPDPNTTVTIDISSSDLGEGTIDKTSLIFDPNNWDILQAVTITGEDDPYDDGNTAYTIDTAAAVSDDNDYDGLDTDDVSVENLDDDTAGIDIDPNTPLTTTESLGTAQFTVVLTSSPDPNTDVTIDISSSNPEEGTVDKNSLSFDPNNWDTLQTVTITGVDDDIDDGDVAYTIETAAAISDDDNYDGLDPDDVSVTNKDNDGDGDEDDDDDDDLGCFIKNTFRYFSRFRLFSKEQP